LEDKKQYNKFLVLCKNKFNYITNANYLRRLSIDISNNKAKFFKIFKNQFPRNKWEKNDIKCEIIFDSKFLNKLKNLNKKIKVTYYESIIEYSNKVHSDDRFSVKLNGKKNFVRNIEVAQLDLDTETAIIYFQKLFIENKSFKQIINELSKEYNLNKKERSEFLDNLKRFYMQFAGLEYIPGD
jgi:hypothetical protein